MLPRPLFTLPLPDAVLLALKKAGCRHYEDLVDEEGRRLEHLTAHVFVHVVCKQKMAEILLKCHHNPSDLERMTASPLFDTAGQLLQNEAFVTHIPTLSQSCDRILSGGVPSSSVLQIVGGPGSGKTQFLLQLCINVQLPECFGGLEGSSVFLDTDLGFSPLRLQEMAEGTVSHCLKIAAVHQMEDEVRGFTVPSVLDSIHYMYVRNHVELLAAIQHLETFIVKHPKVKLIALDSLIFPFLTMINSLERTRIIYKAINKLSKLAEQFNIAVVFSNHLTTKIHNNSKRLVQAMGDAFAHRVPQTLLLAKMNGNFSAVMSKSSSLPEVVALFSVAKGGIRDDVYDFMEIEEDNSNDV